MTTRQVQEQSKRALFVVNMKKKLATSDENLTLVCKYRFNPATAKKKQKNLNLRNYLIDMVIF